MVKKLITNDKSVFFTTKYRYLNTQGITEEETIWFLIEHHRDMIKYNKRNIRECRRQIKKMYKEFNHHMSMFGLSTYTDNDLDTIYEVIDSLKQNYSHLIEHKSAIRVLKDKRKEVKYWRK